MSSWVQGVILTLLGVIISLLVPALISFIQNKRNRKLYGDWHIAFQAPYYENSYHKQKAKLKFHLFGVRLKVNDENFKWKALLKLNKNTFLAGNWLSERTGSKSFRYITLQFSSNGKYLLGHIYGEPSNTKILVGRFLMSRNEEGLKEAYKILRKSEKPNTNWKELSDE